MQITDYPPAPNGDTSERIGLVIDKLAQYLVDKEAQQIQSVGDLKQTVTDITTQVNAAIATLQSAVNTHASQTGAVHGETKDNVGLGKLKNWRNSVSSDTANGTYSDEVYLTSDIAQALAEALVKTDLTNFIEQGQLPLAYFEGGQYGALIYEFRNKVSYLRTQIGLLNATTGGTTKLLRVNSVLDIRSASYPMQSRKKISFINNNDEYLFTAPGDKFNDKDYAIDKYFLSSVLQEGFNPTVQEITDQPYIIRNVGWGALNHWVSLVNDANVYTMFNEDFYLGQDKPVQVIVSDASMDPINFISIPGSCIFNTISIAGSIQANNLGVSFFLGDAVFSYPNNDDTAYPSITITKRDLSSATFISPIAAANRTELLTASGSNLLGINGTDQYLGVEDTYNQNYALEIGSALDGITIPWDNLIDFALTDHKIAMVDYSDVDPFYTFGSLVWEYQDVSLLGYIDVMLRISNAGNPMTLAFRCSFRIVLGENILIELLDNIVPSTLTSTGITGGNTLFSIKDSDPFHPVYGRGAFLGFGGHVTGMTRETDVTLAIIEHRFTSLTEWIQGYYLTPEISRQQYPNYPASRTSAITPAPRRIVPLNYNANGLDLMVTAPNTDGVIDTTVLSWPSTGMLYQQPSSDSSYVIRSPNYTQKSLPSGNFPDALMSVIGESTGVALGSMVYGSDFIGAGNEYYAVGDTLAGNNTWSLDVSLTNLISGLSSGFITQANALYTKNNITPANLNYKWLLAIIPNGTSGATVGTGVLVLSDSCGVVGVIKLSLVPNSTTKVFTTTMASQTILNGLTYALSPSPDFTLDTVNSGNEFYDTTLSTESNVQYLQCSRCFGSKHGGCVINVNTGAIVFVDAVQSELGGYPVSNDYVVNYLPVPGSGLYHLNYPATGVMVDATGKKKIDYYADEEVPSITDTDGVAKYQYFIPKGTVVILAGYSITLAESLDCLYDASKTCYLYLSMTEQGVELIASADLREPSVFEVLYGQGSGGFIGINTTPYCVIDNKLFSSSVVGSAVPMTDGLSMDTGTSNWTLK